MNIVEKTIHSAIGNYPLLRKPVVAVYQLLFSFLPSTDYVIADITQRSGYFFGFHDKCPWSADNSLLLAHRYDIAMPVKQVESGQIDVGFFSNADLTEFTVLSRTQAWNWQQGASLQWLGENIVFNDYFRGKPVANIVDIEGNLLDTLQYHVASVNSKGSLAISYSFDRLGCGMPGYGYQSWSKESTRNMANTALGIINLETLGYRELFTLQDIANIAPSPDMKNAFHFFSHGLFSRNNNRFLFLHRWLCSNGRLNARLFSSDGTGRKLFLYPGLQYSHIAWYNSDNIMAYFKPSNMKPGYFYFKENSEDYTSLNNTFLDTDGHPQVSYSNRYIITDTYPDRLRNQYLKLYDLQLNKGIVLAKLRIPFVFRGTRRCDYHPRWNRDDSLICFDSAHSKKRSLCTMKIPFDQI
jgi:hypothetical protein